MERARVNGVGISYEFLPAAGLSTGAVPAVLLNGIAMSVGNWKPFAGALAASDEAAGRARRPLLLHDFRGQLLSERPAGPYSLELHACDLAALLDHLGLGEVDAVGTSYGSEVALAFARLYPERTRSLVVIDGASEVHPLLRAAVASWRAAALADPVAFYRSLVPWTYSESYIALNAEAIAAREKAVAGLPRDYFEAFAALCDAFLAIDETRHLGEIGCPTLVAVGEKDILKHEGYSRIIADGIRGSRFVKMPGLGHGAVIENPGAVSVLLEDFLDHLGS
jgi:3-oxoadipate enol-lactonase